MAKKRIDRKFDVETGVHTFTELATEESLQCDVTRIFPNYAEMSEVGKRLVGHAINAKVGDSAADPEKPTMEQLRATWDTLLDGKWTSRGDGTGVGGRISDVVTALFNLAIAAGKEVTEQAVADWYGGKSDDEKKTWRNKADVQLEVQNIRDKRAKERKKALQKKAQSEEMVLPDFAA